MRAITVVPGQAGSARLDDVPEPDPSEGAVLVDGARPRRLRHRPRDRRRRVRRGAARAATGWSSATSRWAGCARRRRTAASPPATSSPASSAAPTRCRAPTARAASGTCAATAATPSAASRSSHGFGRERWRVEPDFAVQARPAARRRRRAARADQRRRQGVGAHRADRRARVLRAATVLVTGAGPIGLLAALLGVQRGLDVHVLDRSTDGPKPELVARRSARPTTPARSPSVGVEPDIVIECTGARPARRSTRCATPRPTASSA